MAMGAATLPALSRIALALDYPTRPVHLLAGFPPGGIIDIMGRLIAEWLSQHLGQQVIVENRAGAASNIATELVARARPDGYTLLLSSAVNSWNTAIYDKLNFDFIHDLAPVASLVRAAAVMEVTPSFPAKTVPEFIAYAKANPGKVNMGSVTRTITLAHDRGEFANRPSSRAASWTGTSIGVRQNVKTARPMSLHIVASVKRCRVSDSLASDVPQWPPVDRWPPCRIFGANR
jgi:hypothetical protein